MTRRWSYLTWFNVLVMYWCNFGHLSSDWSIQFLAITNEPFVLLTHGWSHLTWFKVLVLHWCNFGHLSSDWSILFLAITHEPFVLMTRGWSHLTWFKVLVLHWCNFGLLSSDWLILFLAINGKLFVVETCGCCHFKLQNVLDIFFSGTFICILFNIILFQLDIFIFHWCCNLLYTFVHWYIFYSIIQDDLSVLWASPRSFYRNCFSSYQVPRFRHFFCPLITSTDFVLETSLQLQHVQLETVIIACIFIFTMFHTFWNI